MAEAYSAGPWKKGKLVLKLPAVNGPGSVGLFPKRGKTPKRTDLQVTRKKVGHLGGPGGVTKFFQRKNPMPKIGNHLFHLKKRGTPFLGPAPCWGGKKCNVQALIETFVGRATLAGPPWPLGKGASKNDLGHKPPPSEGWDGKVWGKLTMVSDSVLWVLALREILVNGGKRPGTI